MKQISTSVVIGMGNSTVHLHDESELEDQHEFAAILDNAEANIV